MDSFRTLFEASPDAYLVLRANADFTIVAATDAYLATTLTERDLILGQPLFAVFPKNPSASDTTGLGHLQASLADTVKTGKTQTMSPFQYDIRRSDKMTGEFEKRFWRVWNVPVPPVAGRVEYIINRVEDVTSQVAMEAAQRTQEADNESLRARAEDAVRTVVSREEELDRARRALEENLKKLRETKIRLEVAAKAGEVATWIWDPATDRVYADEVLLRWSGIPAEHPQGSPLRLFLKAVHPTDQAKLRAAIDQSVEHPSHLEVEYRLRTGDSSWRHVLARSWPELDANGRVLRLVGVVIDVTRLRQTTEALEETQERLRLAAEAAEIGSFSYDFSTGSLAWDPRCREHFWGGPEEPISAEFVYSRVHPEDRAAARSAVCDAITGEKPLDVECRVVSPEGVIRWIHVKGRPYHDDKGAPARLDGITIDVTRQKHVEAELSESEARYRIVVDSLPDYAVFLLDDDGRITHWNAGAERLLGYTAEEILGRSGNILFTPEDRARGEPEKELVTAKLDGSATDDRWHLRKDGTRFFVTGLMSSLADREGRRLGLVKIMRDVTDREAAAQEREHLLESERAARSEAERTSRLKDDFLATLSHELRTPLNAILGWTQVLKTPGLEPDDVAQGLEVIDRNTRIQARLIEDLLDMSRIISGKVRLEVQTILVAEVINAAIDSVRAAAEAKGIHLTAVYHGAGAIVAGDHNRLQQVMWNLLSNAIKFTPRGGRVQVSVASDEDNVTISVSDNGVGIAAEFLPHVFERFRQADASSTRQHGGLGLGLSIVKQLVELHGGTVRAESAGENQGTTFFVSIPVKPRLAAEAPAFARPWAPPPKRSTAGLDLQHTKVLVVDDEADASSLVRRLLEDHHAEVRVAGSMDEALQEFATFRPDVLLSDIGMPGHDGYELIRHLRSLPEGRGLPAAALTAFARGEDRSRALDAGFTTHIAKPVEPAELLTVVAALSERTKGDAPRAT